ncbi:MAG: S-layer homology domain-containing protein [Thermoanaerobaculia bacterium]
MSLLLACPLLGGHYTWTTAGPEPGFVFQIVVNPQDSNSIHVTAGFYGSMLFDTTDGSQSWRQNEALSFAGQLIQDPSNGDILYTRGYSAGRSVLLKTLNGGMSWSITGSGIPSGATYALAPSSPATLYAVVPGSPGQVYRSDDGAATWTPVSSAFPSNYAGELAIDPSDPSVLFAAVSSGLLKSVDGGVTWNPGGSLPSLTRLRIDPFAPAVLYAGTTAAGVYKSTDGGQTWNPANAGMEDQSIRDLALDPTNPQKLLATSSGSAVPAGGVFVTTNAGQSWTRVDLGEPVNLATAAAFDPQNPSLVYVGASQSVLRGGLFRSADGGATWQRAEKGLSGCYSFGVAPNPALPGSAVALSAGRVFRTDSRGADWVLQGSASYALSSIVAHPGDENTLYAAFGTPAGGGDGVFKSVDGGATWIPATAGLSVSQIYRLAVAPSAGENVLAPTFDGLFGTSDGGGLWGPLLSGDVRAAAFDSADPGILYAGFSAGASQDGLLRSHDGGATWAPPSGLPASYLRVSDIAIPHSDPSSVYVAAGFAGLFRSADRGLTFAPAVSGLPIGSVLPYRLALDPTNAATLYLATSPGGAAAATDVAPANVFRTTDGAGTWKPLPGFLPSFGTLDFASSADGRLLYASTLSGVFQFERSFADVPDADPFWTAIDAAAMNGVSAGCGGGNFCPRAALSRAGAAVFLLRGKNNAAYLPPAATGTVFTDVPASLPAAAYIEELSRQGITAGCGGGAYCPGAPVTRAQFAVLVLKTEHGNDYMPPPATGAVFADVPAGAFAAGWIEQLAAEGVTAGCGGGNFCPVDPVSRAQAAALVVRALGLS